MVSSTALPTGASFTYNVGRDTLETQSRRAEALDTKAGVLLAIDAVMVGLAYGSQSDQVLKLGWWGAAAATAILTSFLIALIAFANRRYRTAPAFAAVLPRMANSEDWLRWRFLGNLQEAIEINRRKLNWKSRLLTLALLLLFGHIAILGGYLIRELALQLMNGH